MPTHNTRPTLLRQAAFINARAKMGKMALVGQLDKKEKTAFYAVLDAFLVKKEMKDALSNVLTNV